MDNFAVVEFLKDKSVAVIPSKWVFKDEAEILKCYWPRKNVSQRIMRLELPDTKWNAYDIKVFAYTDSYDKGRKLSKLAEETSHLESDESETVVKRKRKPVIHSDDGDVESDNEPAPKVISNTKATSVQLPEPPEYHSKGDLQNRNICASTDTVLQDRSPHYSKRIRCSSDNDNLSSQPAEQDCSPAQSDKSQCSSQSGRNANAFTDRSAKKFEGSACSSEVIHKPSQPVLQDCSPAESDRTQCSSQSCRKANAFTDRSAKKSEEKFGSTNLTFQINVLTKLDRIIENQENQVDMLRQLVSFNHQADSSLIFDDFVSKVINSKEEFDSFNDKLLDRNFRNNMVVCLTSFAGGDLAKTSRRIMRRIATNRVWELYSLKGRLKKESLCDLPIFSTVKRAIMKVHRKDKEVDIDEAIAEVLRHAPHRPGGSKYKAKGTKKCTTLLEVSDGNDVETSSTEVN